MLQIFSGAYAMKKIKALEGLEEKKEQRLANAKIYSLGGLKRRICITNEPLHFTDERGQLQDIELTPVDLGDSLEIQSAPYRARVSKEKIAVLFSARQSAHGVMSELIFDGEVPYPQIKENSILWENVYHDLDIELKFFERKCEFFKILKTESAPKSLTWEYTSTSGFAGEVQEDIQGWDSGKDPRGFKRYIELVSETEKISSRKWRTKETFTGKVFLRDENRIKRLSNDVQYPVIIDASLSLDSGTGADTGYSIGGFTNWYANDIYVGLHSGGVWQAFGGIKFNSVQLPQNITIDSAAIECYAINATPGTDAVEIQVEIDNSDSAQNWTASNRPDQLTGVTAAAQTIDVPTSNTYFTLSGLESIVQTVVDREGWKPGNNMRFALNPITFDAGEYQLIEDDSANRPTLLIDYTELGPRVRARTNARTTTANTTSHAITLPSSIVAGELLLVHFAVDGNPTVSINTGVSGNNWTILGQASNSNVVTGAIIYKVAEGSDVLTLTTSASEQSSHTCYAITGASGVVTGTSSNGSSTNSDPPSHSPAAGSKHYLWIATRAGDSTTVATVAPANFVQLQTQAAAGTNGASSNAAEYYRELSVLDPSTFTSGNEQWACWNVAVEPADTTLFFNANTLSGTFSTQAPTVTATASPTVSPGVLSASFSVQAPTITATTNATFNAPVLSASFSTQAPAVSLATNAEIFPSAQEATFSTQAPTLSVSSQVSPAALSSTFSQPAPAISASATASPTTLSGTFSFNAPTITATTDAQVSPAVQEGAFSVQSPALSVSSTHNAAALEGTFSVQAPAVSSSSEISPGALSASFSLNAPTISTSSEVNVTPGVLSATLTAIDPSITATSNVTATPGALDGTFSAQSPSISASSEVSAAAQEATFSAIAPALSVDTVFNAPVLTASFSEISPGVAAGGSATYNAGVREATFTAEAPSISASASTSPGALSASFSVNAPTVSTDASATVNASALSASFSAQAPTVSIQQDATVTASTQSASFTAQAPTISASSQVSPAVQSIIASLNSPNLSVNCVFLAPSLSLSCTGQTPGAVIGDAQYLLLEGEDFLGVNSAALRL